MQLGSIDDGESAFAPENRAVGHSDDDVLFGSAIKGGRNESFLGGDHRPISLGGESLIWVGCHSLGHPVLCHRKDQISKII